MASARPGDPVVLKGSQTGRLSGINPGSVVAFRSTGSAWEQVPVQVDERKVVDVKSLYAGTNTYIKSGTFNLEIYADPSTRSGVDPNTSLDANDEIVFMAGDSGVRTENQPLPDGVVPGSGVEVSIEDPIDGGTSYVYLFQSDNSLVQSADKWYVEYDPVLNLPGGSYKDNYDYFFPLNGSPPANGYNPEDSTVTTEAYQFHSKDRWIDDELRITAGDATGVDILDREKVSTLPFACSRTEDTFTGRAAFHTNDNAEGTFVANVSGPVRAIRSYMGANSGPFTQREHVFYATRQEVRTFLRVHSGLPQLMAFVDYSAAASGMTYRNALYPPGMLVDGERDYVDIPPDLGRELTYLGYPTAGGELSAWEQITGDQGTVNIVSQVRTDIANLEISAYHLDESDTNPNSLVIPSFGRVGADETYQCTGDNQAFASSGMMIKMPGEIVDSSIPNTDPHLGTAKNLTMTRLYEYGAPGQDQTDAQKRQAEFDQPVETATASFDPVVIEPPDEFNLTLNNGVARFGSLADTTFLSEDGPATLSGEWDTGTNEITVPSGNVSMPGTEFDVGGGTGLRGTVAFSPNGTHLAGTWNPNNGQLVVRGPFRANVTLDGDETTVNCHTTVNLRFSTDRTVPYRGSRFTEGLDGEGAIVVAWDTLGGIRGAAGCPDLNPYMQGPGGMRLSHELTPPEPPIGPLELTPPTLIDSSGAVATQITPGRRLICVAGTWSNVTRGTFAWKKNGGPFSNLKADGAGSDVYRPTHDDVGSTFSCHQVMRNNEVKDVAGSSSNSAAVVGH